MSSSAQSPSKLLGLRPGQHSRQVLMQEVPEETDHSERLGQNPARPDPLAIFAALRVVLGFPKQLPKCASDDLPKRFI